NLGKVMRYQLRYIRITLQGERRRISIALLRCERYFSVLVRLITNYQVNICIVPVGVGLKTNL
ncbi:hypothetical protein, partial [Corynebacterium sp. 212_CJEI]|uniref:hypothetical protein n=1 Tax=Corynebacterium sp. 212_CJEI TaxID=2715675 RepID=UPI000666BFA9